MTRQNDNLGTHPEEENLIIFHIIIVLVVI